MVTCFFIGMLLPVCWSILGTCWLPTSGVSPVDGTLTRLAVASIPVVRAGISLIPFALSLVLAFGLFCAGSGFGESERDGSRFACLIVPLCAGVLAWHPVQVVLPANWTDVLWLPQLLLVLCVALVVRAIGREQRLRQRADRDRLGRGRAMNEPARGSLCLPSCRTPALPLPITRESLRILLPPEAAARLSDFGLTGRELDVVCAHAAGLSSAQAGRILGISDKTVREYRRRCKIKLGTDDLGGFLNGE